MYICVFAKIIIIKASSVGTLFYFQQFQTYQLFIKLPIGIFTVFLKCYLQR